MKPQLSIKITDILQREHSYADFALQRLTSEMRPYEKKYAMSWYDFMRKFDKGELGDDKVWFDWYALALGAKEWEDTKKEIEIL